MLQNRIVGVRECSPKQVVKALLLINPSNPLGDIYSPELLLDIFSFCNEQNLHVIMDEVYALSVFNGSPEFYSTLKFPVLPNKNKVHVLYGISKDFGIAGLRIGAIHTRCKPLKNCLKQLSFFHDIPFPVMDIAAKFVDDLDWLKMYLSIYRQRISEKFKESIDYCKRMGLNVRDSSGGFFLWLDFRPRLPINLNTAPKGFLSAHQLALLIKIQLTLFGLGASFYTLSTGSDNIT
ncbi:putative inactive 1-aminocyclopropane-1-carboxylate synthase-like protein 2 [Araneus ventricosus]|uniref:Putative inactive 1-aminocyclopropane-1-carboxylate synthase-like protein 2 n=1 Tax=Araneus ventricosus TaxID=182803 RepID=A0A4Y2HG04_ARAVE|nr:putative inactive 1-aminocyclopropane-1-carboxylate synthase-like protein 2 [Araneus ventricosus]